MEIRYRKKNDPSYIITITKDNPRTGVVDFIDNYGKTSLCTKGTLNREYELMMIDDNVTIGDRKNEIK